MRTTYPTEFLDPEFLWDESGYDEKYGPGNPHPSRAPTATALSVYRPRTGSPTVQLPPT